MHAGQLAEVRLSNVDVEGLALVNVGSSVRCHVNQCALGNLPYSLVKLLQVLRDALNFLQFQNTCLLLGMDWFCTSFMLFLIV